MLIILYHPAASVTFHKAEWTVTDGDITARFIIYKTVHEAVLQQWGFDWLLMLVYVSFFRLTDKESLIYVHFRRIICLPMHFN